MHKSIDKELINHLQQLEAGQQEKVIAYIKELLAQREMNARADESEVAIADDKVHSFEQFDKSFEHWGLQKKADKKQ